MFIVFLTIIIMYVILIAWSYHNLGGMEISKKIIWILASIFIVYIATNITFGISKGNIEYPSTEIMLNVRNILVAIFAGINGLFIIPFVCKWGEELYQENIDTEQLFKRIGVSLLVLIVLLFVECGYMSSTQNGILQIINRSMEVTSGTIK